MSQAVQKYERDWAAYTLSRQQAKRLAEELLSDALTILDVKTIAYRTGRPPFPLRDKLFLCVQKVLRDGTYDSNEEFIEYAKLKGHVKGRPKPHSVADFMNDPQITPLLTRLVTLTATPLGEYERSFSIDSTGLSTYGRERWVNIRRMSEEQRLFRKMHTVVGNKTNIIVAAQVTPGTRHDSPLLPELVETALEYFTIKELCGDKAYCSRDNVRLACEHGITPYLMPKDNYTHKSRGSMTWTRMMDSFKANKGEFLQHYHQRSNVEATYSSFKRRIARTLRSKKPVSQTNEALCIAIVHNLYCLVTATYCLNTEIMFESSMGHGRS